MNSEADDLRAKFAAADRKLALIEVLAALWEAGATIKERAADASSVGNPVAEKWRGIALLQRAHAESIRDILREG